MSTSDVGILITSVLVVIFVSRCHKQVARVTTACVFLAFFVLAETGAAQQTSACGSPGFSGFATSGPYVWSYRASDGMVCIGQLDPFVAGFVPIYQYKWDHGFSSFVGFSWAGANYIWAYRASDGIVAIHQIKSGGNGFIQKNFYKWDTGYSGFAAPSLNGVPYIWAYRAGDGLVCIHKITLVGPGFTTVFQYKWDTGFSSFVLAGADYVWAYRASDGLVTIHHINNLGNGFTQKYYYKWDTGFSGFASMNLPDGAYVWAYRARDGLVTIHQINSGGSGFTQKYYYKWDTDFSGFSGISTGSNAYVLAYRTRGPRDSLICIHQINSSGKGFTQVFYKPYYCSWQRRSGWVTQNGFRVELILDYDGSSLNISSKSQSRIFGFWLDVTSTASYSGSFSGPLPPWQPIYPNPFTLSASSVPAYLVHFNDFSTCFAMEHGKYTMEALSPNGGVVEAKVEW